MIMKIFTSSCMTTCKTIRVYRFYFRYIGNRRFYTSKGNAGYLSFSLGLAICEVWNVGWRLSGPLINTELEVDKGRFDQLLMI